MTCGETYGHLYTINKCNIFFYKMLFGRLLLVMVSFDSPKILTVPANKNTSVDVRMQFPLFLYIWKVHCIKPDYC